MEAIMIRLIFLMLGLLVSGCANVETRAPTKASILYSNFILSGKEAATMTPKEAVRTELRASEEAVICGDYKSALLHAGNVRFIVQNTKEELPKELPVIERIARHEQVEAMIADADFVYRTGSYNEAVSEFDQAVSIMKTFGIHPSHKALLLAQKIDSKLLHTIYLFKEIPTPPLLHI